MKELPEINVLPVHEAYLPISKVKLKFIPYTAEQERNVITSFEADEIGTVINNYKKLIGECFHDSIDFDNLTAQEFILMAINLRCKSKGEILDITTKCQKCGKAIETSKNIEDNIILENETMVKDICKIDDELSFEVAPVKMPFLLQLENIKTDGDLMIQTAVHSITKVFWKDDIYTEFTPDTLREKIKLTYPILTKIFETVNKLIKMKLRVEIICLDKDCAHKEEYFIQDFLKYLS